MPVHCGDPWWRHEMGRFSALLAICARNSTVVGDFPPKKPVLTCSLICTWTNGWINNRDAGDFIHHHAHYDVIVMLEALKVAHCLRSCTCLRLVQDLQPRDNSAYLWSPQYTGSYSQSFLRPISRMVSSNYSLTFIIIESRFGRSLFIKPYMPSFWTIALTTIQSSCRSRQCEIKPVVDRCKCFIHFIYPSSINELVTIIICIINKWFGYHIFRNVLRNYTKMISDFIA